MATAAKIEARRGAPVALPTGVGDDKRQMVSPTAIIPVHLTEQLETGETIVVEELPDLPLGTTELYVQNRMCGDFYCLIAGNRDVAAIGDTRQDAFRNALKLARAA